MICVFDLGNSELKIGVFDNDTLIKDFRSKTDRNKTCDEYASVIKSLLIENNIDLSKIDGTILSSVVPELTVEIVQAISQVLVEPLVIGPGVKTGIILKVDNPTEVGSDLVAGCVGTFMYESSKTKVIVDAGTATKLIVLNAKNEFLGVIICPGMQVSAAALVKSASALPELALIKPKKIIGTNTIDCMKSGIVEGHASMIDGLIKKINDELHSETDVFLTGGLGSTLDNCITVSHILDKNLLLKGLYLIYKRNS